MFLAVTAFCVFLLLELATFCPNTQSCRIEASRYRLGVNGAEWDILKPLLVRGEMPNLARVMQHGVSGKLKTVSAPNCPKVYSIFATSAPSEENGITGSWSGESRRPAQC